MSQGCNLLSQLNYLKVWKKWKLQTILSTPRLTDAGNQFLIFRFSWSAESVTLRLNDMGSWRLSVSLIRGVGDSLHHQYKSRLLNFKKKTLSIDNTESRRLPAPVIRWVTDSPNRWVGESPTPRITDMLSHSAYHWVGELMTPRISDTGSRYSKKKLIWCPFSELLMAKPCHQGAKNKPGM